MTAFQAYVMYLGIRLHFTSDYDYHKYNGVVKADITSFEKRKDKNVFYKLSRLYPDSKNLENFYVSQWIVTDIKWSDYLLSSEAEDNYKRQQKVLQSFSKIFKNEVESIVDFVGSKKFPYLFIPNKDGNLKIENYLLMKSISPETFLMLNEILKFMKTWNDNPKLIKYQSWIKKYNVTKFSMILKEILVDFV